MKRGCLYPIISLLIGAFYASIVGIWFPELFIFVLIVTSGIIFLALCVGCMGDYTVRLVDKGDVEDE